MTTATLSSSGQIAIPKAVRERLHLEAGTQLSIDVQGEQLVIRRVDRDCPDWRTMRGMVRGGGEPHRGFDGRARRRGSARRCPREGSLIPGRALAPCRLAVQRKITRLPMPVEYVRLIEGQYLVGGTRVSLDSLVYLFREGLSVESMVDSYPALTLEQVHGALAFYLGNQKEVDAYLAEGQRVAESQHQQSRQTNADLIAKLQRARHASQVPD